MLKSGKIGYTMLCLLLFSCGNKTAKEIGKEDLYVWKNMKVTATAYNSFPSQTSYEHPGIAAWGDTLVPGMKCIAVSRDLIAKGLTHNTRVKIDRLEGVFLVKDKMHGRWRNRIDIYMGVDKAKALEWGRKNIWIQYAIKKDTLSQTETE